MHEFYTTMPITWDTCLEVDSLRACFKVGFIDLENNLHRIGGHIGESSRSSVPCQPCSPTAVPPASSPEPGVK